MSTELLRRIPPQDWEATPDTVRALLLSLLPLATEVSELRARLHEAEQQAGENLPAETQQSRQQVERYQSLVDRLFLDGLTQEEEQELERLGVEIDSRNAPFYEAALRRMDAIGSR